MPTRKITRNSNDPRDKSWKQVSLELRNLQEKVGLHKGRFAAAGRQDITDELEHCVQLLMDAEEAAMTLDLKDRGLR
jgi:hypothetical protein